MLNLFKTLVRPHVEYYVQFWVPDLRKDVKALERVQRRFPRIISGIKNCSYEDRLERL